MPIIIRQENILYIAVQNQIIVYNTEKGTVEHLNLPEVIIPQNLSKGQEDVLRDGSREINCLCASRDGLYLTATTLNKQVVIFSADGFKVVKNINLNRVASKICFTPSNDLLVADKTGDAYLYKINCDDEPINLLGHLSMLLDIGITDDGKYIATSDRDEKIRISHYPNSYNILSYCLGHREFVTNVYFCGEFLISASGDGTIRIWDWKTGNKISVIDTNENVKEKDAIDNFCAKMDAEKVDVKALPITDMQVHKNNDKLYICVSILNLNYLQLYTVSCNNNKVETSLLQNIVLSESLCCFNLTDNLYVLAGSNIYVYKFIDCKYEQTEDTVLNKLVKDNIELFKISPDTENFTVLYKRKFDNVQEYLERKRQRLEGK